jgi:hypothetical protein
MFAVAPKATEMVRRGECSEVPTNSCAAIPAFALFLLQSETAWLMLVDCHKRNFQLSRSISHNLAERNFSDAGDYCDPIGRHRQQALRHVNSAGKQCCDRTIT